MLGTLGELWDAVTLKANVGDKWEWMEVLEESDQISVFVFIFKIQ